MTIPKGFTLGWNILGLVIWFIFQDEDKLKTLRFSHLYMITVKSQAVTRLG